MKTTLQRTTIWTILALLALAPVAFAGEYHRESHGFLGVELDELTPELQSHFGAPDGLGILVSRVEEDSPAWQAGIRVGDVITSIDGRSIESSWDAMETVADRPGEQVGLEIVREGERMQLTAELGTRTRESRRHRAHSRREIRIEADVEELEESLEQLGRQMETLGEEIGYRVEVALEDVDWDELGRTIERSLAQSLRALDTMEIEVDMEEMERELERSLESLEESLEELEHLEIEISSPAT